MPLTTLLLTLASLVPQSAIALILLALAIHIRSTVTQSPVELQWSANPYGPDGPWNVVEIEIGGDDDPQRLSFFPGASFQTTVPTTELCAENQTLRCFISYNKDKSEKAAGSDGGIGWMSGPGSYAKGLRMVGDDLTSWVDDFNLLSGGISVTDVSMGLMDRVFIEYPNGEWYPPVGGCLSLGAPDVKQTFETDSGPAVNASIISGNLWDDDKTSSNSFGLHIGSVTPPIPGSLLFGGYDQRRVMGDVLSFEGASYREPIVLVDLAINVFQGQSPFEFDKKQEGILAAGNDSMSNGLRVRLDGCSPYISLPESTCESLADHLPISYDTGLGLYLWDTDNETFGRIMGSASALTFSLTADGTSDTIEISVPFQHLNLTLTEPLVEGKAQYFPCSTGGSGEYVLGRAFLQSAFVGGNWNEEVFWIAQAPGPDGTMTRDVVELADGDMKVESRDGEWLETWTGYWDGLNKDGTLKEKASALSTSAKAGIGVGVSLGVIALIAAAVFFLRRKRRAAVQTVTAEAVEPKPHNAALYYDNFAESRVVPELSSGGGWNGPTAATWTDPVEVPATPLR